MLANVTIFDLKTLKVLGQVKTGLNPDAIIYDPVSRRVFAFNGRSADATAIDAASGTVAGTIPLGGKPEFAVFDPEAKRIYCNLEDKSEVAAIDADAHSVAATWPIAPGEGASGMAIDLKNHRLFLGCDNKLMVMMNSQDGKVVATVPIGQGVDANAFDPATGLAFSSNGEGTVTIAHEDGPDKLTVVQTLTTTRGAKTMALDPKTHQIYLGAAEYEKAAAGAPGKKGQRPKIIPGSFKVLVYGMEK
jgi:DNA-binding beta-propeller fold protein YncE